VKHRADTSLNTNMHAPNEKTGLVARSARLFLWFILPVFAVLMVLLYVGDSVVNHVYPPVVPVSGLSMRPVLQAGDLVFLKGVSPKSLRVGDVIAVNVPVIDQKQYALPSRIVHRIVRIKHDQLGPLFVTKGDANAGVDVFATRSNNVIGKLQFKITGLGYPFLFFRSRQGLIFLGSAALLFLLYFVMGIFEDRRIAVSGNAFTLEMLLAETRELRESLAIAREPQAGAMVDTPHPDFVRGVDELKQEVRMTRESGAQTSDDMRQLIGAVSEYGKHLQSHTAVMQNLASATFDLQRATAKLSADVGASEVGRRGSSLDNPAWTSPRTRTSPRGVRESFLLQRDLAPQREALAERSAKVEILLRSVFDGHDDIELNHG
jgi:signal peptidase I